MKVWLPETSEGLLASICPMSQKTRNNTRPSRPKKMKSILVRAPRRPPRLQGVPAAIVFKNNRPKPQNLRGYTNAKKNRALLSFDKVSTGHTQVLALCIAEPGKQNSMRFPTTAPDRVSIMTAMDQYTFSSPTVGNTASGFNNTDLLVAYYGQPGRTAMVWQSGLSSCTYALQFEFGNIWRGFYGRQPQNNEPVNNVWPLISAVATSAGGPHGASISIGRSADFPYIFLNNTDTINVTGGTVGTLTGACNFEILQWQGRNQPPIVASSATAAMTAGSLAPTTLYTASSATGFFYVVFTSITYSSGSATEADVQMSVVTNFTSGWCLIHHSDVDPADAGDPNILQDCRATAASLLFTNATNVLNRGGVSTAARLRSVDFLDVTPSILSRAAEVYTGDAGSGIYTFKEFGTYAEQFRSEAATGLLNTTSVGVSYNLDYDDYYHFIRLGSTGQTNQYNACFNTTLEFRNDSNRYSKDVAPLNYSDLITARKLISSNPVWFYENPLHMREIYNFVVRGAKRVVRGLQVAAPYAAAVGGMMVPQQAAAYGVLAAALQGLRV